MKSEVYMKKIIEHTGLTQKEVQKFANEKVEELKGLISLDGALFIIAKELGVPIETESLKFNKFQEFTISEIKERGMKNITLNGRIHKIYEVKEFMKKDGTEGQVLNFILSDKTGIIRIVVWDKMTKVAEDPDFKINALIQITHGYSKYNDYYEKLEVHLGYYSVIVLNPAGVDPKEFPEIEVIGDDDW